MDPRSVIVAVADESLEGRLGSLLEGLGLFVVYASSGAQVLRSLLRGDPIEVVVAAARLPGLGGLQLAKLARGHGVTAPFLVLSLTGDPSLRATAAQLDDVVLVEGTPTTDELRARLGELVARPARARPPARTSAPPSRERP